MSETEGFVGNLAAPAVGFRQGAALGGTTAAAALEAAPATAAEGDEY